MEAGNAVAEVTFTECAAAHRAGRDVAIENPSNSYLWFIADAVELAKQDGVHRIDVTNCMFEGAGA